MNKKICFISLGCSKNQVDTEVMIGSLGMEWSITSEMESADAIVVNTCGFIDSAKQESVRTILEMAGAKKDGAKLVVAGCLSERYREDLAKELPEVDLFTGVGDFNKLAELLNSNAKTSFSENVFLQNGENRVVINSNYHAYIKISEGCNQSCSFCAIPQFKGKLKSRSIESIANEVKNFVSRGFFDFSFIAQDSSSYGKDLDDKDGLIKLIDAIEAINGDFHYRILYLYPSTTNAKLIKKMAKAKKLLPYFDMPVQHISDKMLKTMKRGSGTQKIVELLETMQDVPNAYLRTGLIVGHPNESDEDFEELARFLEEFDFDGISVFEYSDEESVAAHKLKHKIDAKTKKARLKVVQKIIDKKLKVKAKAQIGKQIEAIVEGESEEHEYLISAKAVLWAPEIDGELLINESEVGELKHGMRVLVEVTQSAGKTLIGRAISAK
ncbi:MAG: hypothetical protein RL154_1015 [Pseudomonadota bacterium]|jgi:ribosomal protein S12 methylthiotransferase RimO